MGAAGAVGAGQLGLGVYNAFRDQPEILPSGGYTQIIPNVSPQSAQSSNLSQLYMQHLLGGQGGASPFEQWQQGTQQQIADLRSQLPIADQGTPMTSEQQLAYAQQNPWSMLQGTVPTSEGGNIGGGTGARVTAEGGPASFEDWAWDVYGMGAHHLDNADAASKAALKGEYNRYVENVNNINTQIGALEAQLGSQQDIPWELGTLSSESPERLQQLGELSGSYEDILKRRAEQSYQQQLASLARRGVTGGSPESELGQRKAETIAGIADQALQFQNQLRDADQTFKLNLFNAIQNGLAGEAARGLQQQQIAGNLALGQQQLSAQQAYNQQIADMQRQQALAQTLGLAGQGITGLFGGGGQQQQQPSYMDYGYGYPVNPNELDRWDLLLGRND